MDLEGTSGVASVGMIAVLQDDVVDPRGVEKGGVYVHMACNVAATEVFQAIA